MFFSLFITLLLGFVNPSDSKENNANTQVKTIQGTPGSGGETGQLPPPK